MAAPEPVTILLIEDEPGHARLIERCLRRSRITNELRIFDNGQDAVDHLFATLDNAPVESHHPMLILLDLSLPVLDGFQVLECIKADKRTQHIPIIILSTIDVPDQIDRCYALGCNIYLTKPVHDEDFAKAIEKLGLFLSIVKIPTAQEQTLMS
ncbi:response regulator [Candidatus Entotheonella palauensis]|uniref:response regulator n=1 Tax=Candidatus Entotheonella palauensis TaxID=93172 RepID=UPI000B7F0387|nr:response regulator [Candidatus Entotheonella palauensis]